VIDKNLLKQFLHDYPFQPATAVWRASEIAHVLQYPFPMGYGLDLGCGDGRLTNIIFAQVGRRETVGIDLDSSETALAESLKIYQRIHVAPAHQIPEADDTFDWVFSNSVLEHIPNLDEVLQEVSRVLKPGGLFLLTVPGKNFHDCLRGPLLPWSDRKAYLDEVDVRFACLRYWSPDEWSAHLQPHGLEIQRSTFYQTPAEAQRWETIARFTSGILYGLMGRRKQPIEIQRSLGVRKPSAKMPWFLASMLSHLLALGLESEKSEKHEPVMGGLMLLIQKRSP
jgi:SAM-dependent methyltransferase